MSSFSLSIDDYLAQASPVLGRMRLDGLTDTAVPFSEGIVVLWRRGAASADMSVEVLKDVLKVCPASSSVLRHCAPTGRWARAFTAPRSYYGAIVGASTRVRARVDKISGGSCKCVAMPWQMLCRAWGGAFYESFAVIEGRVVFSLFNCSSTSLSPSVIVVQYPGCMPFDQPCVAADLSNESVTERCGCAVGALPRGQPAALGGGARRSALRPRCCAEEPVW